MTESNGPGESPHVPKESGAGRNVLVISAIVLALILGFSYLALRRTPETVRQLSVGGWATGSYDTPKAYLSVNEADWTLEIFEPAPSKSHGTWELDDDLTPAFKDVATGQVEKAEVIDKHGHQLPQLVFRGMRFYKQGIKD